MQHTKLKNLATFNMGQSPSSSFVSENENGTPFLQGNADFGPSYPNTHLYCQKPLKIAEKGDILVSVRAPVGALNKANQIYCIGRGLAAVRFNRALPNFGWHLLNYWVKDLSKTAQGSTFEAVNKTDLENLSVVPFENEEQCSIAHILDTLDTQIQQTEALVAKLKQVKAGLMHDLLTRGIDENGEVRDPVAHPEKFKEATLSRRKTKIPRAWISEPLNSFLTGIDAGKSPNCLDQPAGAEEWGILKVSAIHPKGFRAEENKVVTNLKYVNAAYEVRDGDLLISRANTYELVGMVCLVKNPRSQLLLCDKTLRLHIDSGKALNEFIFYILQMPFVRTQIQTHATGSSGSMKNISQGVIKGLSMYMPPLEEQRQIVTLLKAHDARITAEESHLAKLRLLKRGLMDDLLTGRVRVKEFIADDECLRV